MVPFHQQRTHHSRGSLHASHTMDQDPLVPKTGGGFNGGDSDGKVACHGRILAEIVVHGDAEPIQARELEGYIFGAVDHMTDVGSAHESGIVGVRSAAYPYIRHKLFGWVK